MGKKLRIKKGPLIIVICIIILTLGLVAFFLLNTDKKDGEKEEDVVYVTITFDSDGGSEVPNKKIKEGETIKLPETEKEGFTLEGWYDGEEKVDEETTYSKNTTLKAKWEEEKTFKVSFDSDGGSKIEAITIVCNKKIELPEEPTKKGYTFVKWTYKKDDKDIEVSDGSSLPCEDIKLTANWEKEKASTYLATFLKEKGGSQVYSFTVECGKEISLPKAPDNKGYDFVAWNDKNGKAISDGAVLACEDITLYATWKKSSGITPTPEVTSAPEITPTSIPATPTPSPELTPTPVSSTPTPTPEITATPVPATPTPEPTPAPTPEVTPTSAPDTSTQQNQTEGNN